MVLKPAEQTPLTVLALVRLAEAAGTPAGVLNIVTCSAANAPLVGRVMTRSASARKLPFAGSTGTAPLHMRDSASTIQGLSIPLGRGCRLPVA